MYYKLNLCKKKLQMNTAKRIVWFICLMMFLMAVVLSCSGCAAISNATAGVNWYKLGSYACIRLSETLNKKAEEKEQEIAEQTAQENKPEETKQEEVVK